MATRCYELQHACKYSITIVFKPRFGYIYQIFNRGNTYNIKTSIHQSKNGSMHINNAFMEGKTDNNKSNKETQEAQETNPSGTYFPVVGEGVCVSLMQMFRRTKRH